MEEQDSIAVAQNGRRKFSVNSIDLTKGTQHTTIHYNSTTNKIVSS